jgi:hypothetical protein
LGVLADAIGIEVAVSHRAMGDVLTMEAISKYFFRRLREKGVCAITPQIFL